MGGFEKLSTIVIAGGIVKNANVVHSSLAISGGIVYKEDAATVYGNTTLEQNLEIEQGQTLTIPQGASLTIPENVTLTNNGTLTIYDKNSLKGEGKLEGSGSYVLTPTITVPENLVYNGQDQTDGITFTVNTSLDAMGKTFKSLVTDFSTPSITPEEVKDAGNYTVTSTYTTDGGGTGTVTNTFTVAKANLQGVNASRYNSMTYNGKDQLLRHFTTTKVTTPAGGEEVTFAYSLTESSGYSPDLTLKNAGTYTVYYKASAANHNDATGSFSMNVVPFTLTNSNVSVSFSPMTYNGKAQTPVSNLVVNLGNGNAETITGLTWSSVTYVNDTTSTTVDNAKYSNFKTATFEKSTGMQPLNISGAEITLGDALTYNGEEQTQTVASVKVGDLMLTGADYTVSGNKETNVKTVGQHTLTITAVNENFTGSATKDWNILPLDISKIAQVGQFETMTYTGSAKTPSAAVTADEHIVTGSWSDVTNVADTTTFTANGNFSGTLTGYSTGMSRKPITAAVNVTDKYWDGTDTAEVSVTLDTGVTGETITVSGVTATFDTAEPGENKTVTLDKSGISYSGASTDNYDITIPTTTTGNVKVIPLTISGVTMDAESYTYGDTVGYNIENVEFDQPGGTVATAEKLTYTYTGTANDGTTWNSTTAPAKAGEYTLTVSYGDTVHYTVAAPQEVDFTIERKPITEPTQAAAVTYNGTAQTYAVTETAEYSVTGGVQTAANEAGYDVTISLTDKNNTCWAGGSLDDLTHKFIINRKPITEPAQAEAVTYNGAEQTYAVASTADYTVETVTEKDANESGYDVAISLTDKNNTCWASGSLDDLTHKFIINRKPITEPTQAAAVTYNGTAQTYAVTETAEYSVTGGVQTAANESGYAVTISLKDKANYQWKTAGNTNDLTHQFIINKAPVTITAKDQSYHIGNDLPETVELDKHYTIEGLAEGDSIGTVTIEYWLDSEKVTPDKNKVESYEIRMAVADPNVNYEITYVSGELSYYYTPRYEPVVEETDGVAIAVSHKNPVQGQTVTVTVTPDDGTEVSGITVTDKDGNPVEVTDNGDGTYSFKQPNGKVTISVEKVCTGTGACPSLAYTDLDTAKWYHEAADYVVRKGLMNGVSNNKFDPNGTTSRAMIVTILWRQEGAPAVEYDMTFEDVPAGKWYTEAVRWAASEGIVTGYSDKKFGPDDDVSREQLATILSRYCGEMGYELPADKGTGFDAMPDVADVSDWAMEGVRWAYNTGLIQGATKDGTVALAPKDGASRCQTATSLYRFNLATISEE